ncbi:MULTISPECIES: helix-turn-helix transcriptional regulator [Catenuloplanes]|uniref:AraC-like DNA-binding protein n=1 Tax=Catenuloplanes niger TaxID=587534 RepID=A0AAE3ZIP6_9ACTN|nr:helix-turn-helix transcriptional regulator [Catenuloplanes niger]MDR7320662.1 AraC-like DNA-binding protein [Catenuloplanes niger]
MTGSLRSRTGPGGVRLVLPDDSEEFDFVDVDVDVVAVRLPRGLLEDVAAARTGMRPADLRFDGFLPMSARLARHWVHTVSYVRDTVLSDPALQGNTLIAEQARHLLAATALAVFPNTSLDAYRPHDDAVTPRAVRRAMAYADSHADRPLTIDDLAAAAGVTRRALQAGFRRHHDTTPMRYVRRVRLARAHADLVAGDPTTGLTVAAVAARWGFTHPGRFAIDYRAAYGTAPGRTLRT